jgi:hypothetical protein
VDISENSTAAIAELQQVLLFSCSSPGCVRLLGMTNHEFLDKSFRKQHTTFADGITVTIDFEKNTFEISPSLSASVDANV